jgi:hypothetical protein
MRSAVSFGSRSMVVMLMLASTGCAQVLGIGDPIVQDGGVESGGTQPTNDGGPPPLHVFVTSLKYSIPDIGGVQGADDHCRGLAGTGTWTAWLTDGRLGLPRGGIVAGTRYVDMAGKPVFTTQPTPTTQASITLDEHGIGVPVNDRVWTGTGSDVCGTCTNWMGAGSDLLKAMAGIVGDRQQWSTASACLVCSQSAHLYCFEMPPP